MSLKKDYICAKLEEYDSIMSNDAEMYKIIMLGDSNAGKTSFVQQYTMNQFYNKESNTIGVSYITKIIKSPKTNNKAKVCIWDTAGQDRFFSIVKMYFKFAMGICCVYDVTNINSLKNCEKWLDESLKNMDITQNEMIDDTEQYSVPILLIGNKIDLVQEKNDFNEKYRNKIIDNYILKYNLVHYECSAKTGKNVNDSILNLISRMKPIIIKKENKVDLNNPKQSCNCY
mgnify:CR=1 FL=1